MRPSLERAAARFYKPTSHAILPEQFPSRMYRLTIRVLAALLLVSLVWWAYRLIRLTRLAAYRRGTSEWDREICGVAETCEPNWAGAPTFPQTPFTNHEGSTVH
jgi:hypothetical protein